MHDDALPTLCTSCSADLTPEESSEQRLCLRPQCFACIDAAWARTEEEIRSRTIIPKAPETIPAPEWRDEPATDLDLEVA